MHLAPTDLYRKLEFDKLLALLQDYALGSLGQERIANLEVLSDAYRIERLLQETFEYWKTLENLHHFPMAAYPDANEDIRLLGIEDYVLSLEGMRAIQRILEITRDLVEFFQKRKEAKDLYPTLLDIVRQVQWEASMLTAMQRIFDAEGNMRPDASPELQRISRLQSSKRQELQQQFQRVIQNYLGRGYLTDNIESFRNGRRVLAVPAEHKRSVRGIIHDESATGKTVFIEPEEVIGINNEIFDLEQEQKREIYRILRDLCRLLHPHQALLQQYQDLLARLDVIQAKARLAQQLKAVKPKLHAQPFYKIWHAFHPLLYLKGKREGHRVVPFEMTLKEGNRILLLSGPNAGGKSICMKAVGLLQLMVQAGMMIPVGEDSEIGIFEQFFADIGDQQSLEDELSTYSSRLKNAQHFLEFANKKTLVLIDEFGSGTDPKMGGAIAEAILRELNYKEVWGVITTHYSNLKIFAHENKGLVNGAMVFDMETLSPTYEMRMGKPGSSYAFEIAEKSGLPRHVIAYAQRKIGKEAHSFDELLVELQRERQAIQEQQTFMQEQQKQLDQLIKNYDFAHKELDFSRKKLKLQIKEQELTDTQQSQKELQKLLSELRQKEKENLDKAIERTKEMLQESKAQREDLTDNVQEIKRQILKTYEAEGKHKEITEGSHVRFRESGSIGIVRKIQRKEALVEIGSFQMKVPLVQLIPMDNPLEIRSEKAIKTDIIQKQSMFEPKLDIRGMRYEDALETIQNFMDEAMMANAREVWIIHGRGTGALRKAVQGKLKEYPNIKEIRHPEYNQGGDGATIVEFS